MMNDDITIEGEMTQSLIVTPDSTKFIYDNGEAIAYIEIIDYSANGEYSNDAVCLPAYATSFEGRFVYNETYYPTHLKVVGETTGTVFYDKDQDKSPTNFLVHTQDYTQFGENLIVIPSFESTLKPEKLGIQTYEQLVEFAENVCNNNAKYGKAEVWLENNIVAPDDSSWTVPIGTLDNPFNGVFDGRGFGIVGLNVSIEDLGGLFGCIGENGLVKDLAVIDCDSSTKSEYAGGIAAVNNGTIDHCLSGVNIDSTVSVYGKNGQKIRPSQYNSYVNGKYAGGIAAANNGKITGTRNGAVVFGEWCGGICADNAGTIYGSANNGAVGRDSVSVNLCGGLTAKNN